MKIILQYIAQVLQERYLQNKFLFSRNFANTLTSALQSLQH